MRKIAFIALFSLPLCAGFFPQTIHTSIAKVTDKAVVLTTPFPVDGMTGVVVHNYGNDLDAITGRIVQNKVGKAKLLSNDVIHHEELPTIKTPITTNDKVIGGYLYNNVLLLAPDAATYASITSSYEKNWIHPDLFAVYLATEGESEPTKENLAKFAQQYQIGLIYIVGRASAKLLDPLSGKIVGQKAMSGLPAKGQSPFFMRLDKIDSGFFSSSDTQPYYKLMDTL